MGTSRRRFLELLGLAGLGLGGCRQAAGPGDRSGVAGAEPPARSASPAAVAVVRCRDAVRASGEVDGERVRRMLAAGIEAILPAATEAARWAQRFQPDDRVAVKVNCLGGPSFSTRPEVAEAVALGLQAAGLPPDRIAIYDRDTGELAGAGFPTTRRAPACVGNDAAGYETDVVTSGAVGTCLSRVVTRLATALVNVPLLKDHDLCGYSGALKNHFGSINNPNKLHGLPDERCSPYVADLNLLPELRDKERLVVMDALRTCYEGGPSYNPEGVETYGALLVGTNALAVDWVGLRLLDELRAEHHLPALMSLERAPKYLGVAADTKHQLGPGATAVQAVEVRL